ncbi:MAG: hypothetical protein AAGH74_03420 [Pseudomonadota bacterium]
MSDLDDALSDIAAIKAQVDRTASFRGFGPAVLLLTAGLAGLGGVMQPYFVAPGAGAVEAYLVFWGAIAMVAVTVIAVSSVVRARLAHGARSRSMMLRVLWLFAPALIAGATLGLAISVAVPETFWLLPGVWQVVLSLGIFAALPALPNSMGLVAAWYLLSGVSATLFGRADIPSPWLMMIPFMVGQTLAAFVFFLDSKRSDGE